MMMQDVAAGRLTRRCRSFSQVHYSISAKSTQSVQSFVLRSDTWELRHVRIRLSVSAEGDSLTAALAQTACTQCPHPFQCFSGSTSPSPCGGFSLSAGDFQSSLSSGAAASNTQILLQAVRRRAPPTLHRPHRVHRVHTVASQKATVCTPSPWRRDKVCVTLALVNCCQRPHSPHKRHALSGLIHFSVSVIPLHPASEDAEGQRCLVAVMRDRVKARRRSPCQGERRVRVKKRPGLTRTCPCGQCKRRPGLGAYSRGAPGHALTA
jgi:hypothetical protein